MSVTPQVTYPGVYIQEVPSAVRTIVGVSTSTTAFIGWARKGPVDKAQRILSWQDFERQYGGLDRDSLLGYAVQHFFSNGGQDTYVIRLVARAGTPGVVNAAVTATVAHGDISVRAKNPGQWGNSFGISTRTRADDATRFRLDVIQFVDGTEVPVETFENLSMTATDRRYVQTVVAEESSIVDVTTTGTNTPANTPSPSPALTGGVDGDILTPNSAAFEAELQPVGPPPPTTGLSLLDHVDLFNILCVPGENTDTVLSSLQAYCKGRRAFLIADCTENASFTSLLNGPPNITGAAATNSAFYFPWIKAPDPLQENRPRNFPPCGFVAGIYSQTDSTRGVFKAPAGIDAGLTGVVGAAVPLTDRENGVLNTQAINCIRDFAVYGTIVWGARTLVGNDERGSEWKYIPVRRMALFLEETLYRNTKWVVFEPNDEPLWAQIRLNIGAFMHSLFRQGAFQGKTPQEAYFVKCDKDTTTQDDINRGIVNILVGFAPLKPAEFVVIKISQIAGQIQT